MLLGSLCASLIGNLLTGKGVTAISQGCEWAETLAMRANMSGQGEIREAEGKIRADEGTIRASQDF